MKVPVTLEEEFRKNEELKKEELEALKDWYKSQPHLPPISDVFLALFFHSCCYRLEPTKVTIDTYFTYRTHIPEFFANRDPFKTGRNRKGTHVVRFIMLPQLTPEGYRVITSSFGCADPSDFNFGEIIKSFLMTADLEHYYNGSSKGFIIALDLTGVTLGHVARLNPLLMKKVLNYLQEAMPVRLKGIHYINVVPFMDKIMSIMRPFLKKELMDSIVMHTRLDTFYKIVPKEMLPVEYGGEGSTIEVIHDECIKLREESENWFKEEGKLRVTEARRPGKAKTPGDIFGVEGSFKKLDLD